jgi:CHASE3 domain sensor protein
LNQPNKQPTIDDLEELIKEMRNIKAIQTLLTGNYPNDKIISRINKVRAKYLSAKAREIAEKIRKEEKRKTLRLVELEIK